MVIFLYSYVTDYKFDFQDSIKWSSNDIAIVKVDKPFKFGVTESGCEFAVCPINYNNISRELEKPGTKGWIAGWGSGNNFREVKLQCNKLLKGILNTIFNRFCCLGSVPSSKRCTYSKECEMFARSKGVHYGQ